MTNFLKTVTTNTERGKLFKSCDNFQDCDKLKVVEYEYVYYNWPVTANLLTFEGEILFEG